MLFLKFLPGLAVSLVPFVDAIPLFEPELLNITFPDRNLSS
jgi:hypothetical protein